MEKIDVARMLMMEGNDIVTSDDVIPLIDLNEAQKTLLAHITSPSEEELRLVIEYLDILPKTICVRPKAVFFPFCYYDGLLIMDLEYLSVEALQMIRKREAIKQMKSIIEQLRAENNFLSMFTHIDKRILFPVYKKLYREIPNEQKYDVYVSIYRRSEYGFGFFDNELIEDILSYRFFSTARFERLEMLDDEEEFTIYRGVTEHSLEVERALSWTFDEKTAHFFATRYNSDGFVLKGKVKKHDIIDYLTVRNEEEVLVHFEDVFDVERIDNNETTQN